jgi:hypothetical protein
MVAVRELAKQKEPFHFSNVLQLSSCSKIFIRVGNVLVGVRERRLRAKIYENLNDDLGGTMLTRISILVLLLAGACLPSPIENPPQPQYITVDATNSPTEVAAIPSPTFEPQDEVQKRLTQMAVDDLARRLALNADSIRVVSIELTAWRDASLGCPLDDKVYAPQKISGYRIRLEAGRQGYVYHTDRTDQIVFCPEPDEPGLR